MSFKHLFPALLGCVLLQPVLAAGSIDPALLGTWKLQWERGDYFWVVREDGVYRLHGPGGPRQYGHLEAADGSWSMKSPFAVLNGTYTLSDADTWTVTGPLGPGVWKRVWSPASRQPDQPAGAGVCALLTPDEVAHALGSPATAVPDPHDPGRCVYKSALGEFDSVSIWVIDSRRQAWFLKRQHPEPDVISVPGIGEDAFADGLQSGGLELHILKGGVQARIGLGLTPGPTLEDLPYVVALGRAADPRLGATGPSLRELLDRLPGR